jgi:hypothetical protein
MLLPTFLVAEVLVELRTMPVRGQELLVAGRVPATKPYA